LAVWRPVLLVLPVWRPMLCLWFGIPVEYGSAS
jgi:hypothetical protein